MDRGWRRGAAAVLAMLASVGGLVPLAAAAEGPRNALTIMGEGGWVVGHESASYASPARFDVAAREYQVWPGRDHVDFIVDMPGEYRLAIGRIGAPTAVSTLAVGRYPSRRIVTADHAQFDLGYDGRGCNDEVGWIDVLALSRGADGLINSLALDFSFLCHNVTQDDPHPVRGSFRWNSDVPYRHTASDGFRAADTHDGDTARGAVTLRNTGTVPQTYGRTTWMPREPGGPEQAPLVVERDGCVGVTLPPGGRCTIEVSARSDGTRGVDGFLRTVDETLRGAAYSPVTMRALPAPGTVTLTATPVRAGVRLSTAEDHRSYRVLRSDGTGAEVEVAKGVDLPWTDTDVAVGARYGYRVVAAITGGEGPPSNRAGAGPLPVPAGNEGTFVRVGPARIVDTRSGLGAPTGPLGAGRSLRFDPAAGGHIPSTGVLAVVLNVTGTRATAPTFLRVWPAGDAPPDTSSLNLRPGQDRAIQVVVPVGDRGQVELYNNAGSTDVVVDVQGYYATADGPHGGGYHVTTPLRAWDTRVEGASAVAPGETSELMVNASGMNTNGRQEVAAVVVNLTVTGATAHGNLSAWGAGASSPGVSNVNFTAGRTVANQAVVPVRYLGTSLGPLITVRNDSPGSVHVIVDVLGWYDDGTSADGLRYRPVDATRLADTRSQPAPVRFGDRLTVPGSALPSALAHVFTVTATASIGAGHLTAWSGHGAFPPTSTVNFTRHEDSPNLTTTAPGPDGDVAVTPGTSDVHVVVDHLGYFY